MILVTGGAGFIGSNFVLDWLANPKAEGIVNLDKLTYAGNLSTLAPLEKDSRHVFIKGDIGDSTLVAHLLQQYRPRAIINFAAESHVDRSIHGPADFIQTNILGSFNLLECTRTHWNSLPIEEQQQFRFLHISTDEVYGSLGANDTAFKESTAYEPNSPYSASKAAATMAALGLANSHQIKLVVARPFHVFGEGESEVRFWPSLVRAANTNQDFPMSHGQQVRDFIRAEDAALSILHLITQIDTFSANAIIKNIGSGIPRTLLSFAEDQWNALDAQGSLLPGRLAPYPNEVMRYVPLL